MKLTKEIVKAYIKWLLRKRRRVVYSLSELGAFLAVAALALFAVSDSKCGEGEVRDFSSDATYAVMSDDEFASHFEERILETPNPRKETKCLTIHHSASENIPEAEAVRDYHIDVKKFPGIGYHALYDPERKMMIQVRGWDDVCPHAYSMNDNSVSICILGNYETQYLDSLDILIISTMVDKLMTRYGLNPVAVCGHGDCVVYNSLNNTACPGKHADVRQFVPRRTEDDYRECIDAWSHRSRFEFTEWRYKTMLSECVQRQMSLPQLEEYLGRQKVEMIKSIKNK